MNPIEKSSITRRFPRALDKKGLISKPGNNSTYSNIVVNELTKRLDRILQSPDLKFLNPNSNLKNQDILIKSDEGNSQSDEIIINQASQKNNTSNEFNSTDSLNNTENKVNLSKDKKGKHKGQNKTQKTRGIAIIVEDFPDDPREGWVDVINNAVVYNVGHPLSKTVAESHSLHAVVYNVGHPLSKTVAESHSLHNYNLTRVIISSLIKAKNDQVDMDAVIAFGYFEKIFCDAWLQ